MKGNYRTDEAMVSNINMGIIKRLLSYLKPYKLEVLLTVVFMSVATVSELLGPYLLKVSLDEHIPEDNARGLVAMAALYLAATGANYVFSRLKIRYAGRIGQNVLFDMRTGLFKHVQNLSFNFFDNTSAGRIIVRIVNDVNTLNNLFTNGIINVITEISMLLVSVAFMFALHVQLALITMITVPLFMIGIFLTRNAVKRKWRTVRRKISNLNAYIHENISGIKVIQAYVRQRENRKIFHGILDDVFSSWMSAIKYNSAFSPSVHIISVLGTAMIFWYGARLLQAGNVTVGIIVAFASYLKHFWRPVMELSKFYNQLLRAMASSERIFELMDQESEIYDLPGAKPIGEISGRVRFKNVSFGYEKGQKVLKNINMDVNPGESIAIVGATGSGKTTIINLVARFYDPGEGSVLLDGMDIRGITLKSLRNNIGIMLQDPFIFSGSVIENIRYGKPDASREEVERAARAVNAHDFIRRMENGYETELQERGSRLSIGERQLIAFARVLLSDPHILILDEATASVDTHTEILLQKAVDKVLKGRTSFVIAHRLSTIRNADRIMVIEKGRIAECGTHSELLDKDGIYSHLYRVQYKALKAV